MVKINTFRVALLVCFSLLWFHATAYAKYSRPKHSLHQYHFSVPKGLESRVDFWKKIYSKYTTKQVVIHDIDNLGIIYEVVDLGNKRLSYRARERKVSHIKTKYKKMLRRLARTKNTSRLTSEEKRIYNMVKTGFSRAARNMRSQLGQADRFRKGIERSGMYMDEILGIFNEYNLPLELANLPHVESSFQEHAYSSAGAAGIWQFTRGTGRLFLRVRYDVDERLDPILATHAAAKLLRHNFLEVNNWPLAITGYNHGIQGMKRAKRKHGSDIVNVIKRYRSRSFGFASKNFYAEFLAALDVARNKHKYFPNLRIRKPVLRASIKLDNYIHINTAKRYFGMTRDEIAKANPALRNSVLSGQKRIPKGYMFNTPVHKVGDLERRYRTIPASVKHREQIRSKWYTVRRGDTLSGIALRFRTSVGKLKRQNNIGRKNRIYIGQVLRLPGRGGGGKPVLAVRKANYVADPAVWEKGNTQAYRVRRHDNLTKIAMRYDTDPVLLAKLNKMRNPNSLYPGQILKIPQNQAPKQKPEKEFAKQVRRASDDRPLPMVRKPETQAKAAKPIQKTVSKAELQKPAPAAAAKAKTKPRSNRVRTAKAKTESNLDSGIKIRQPNGTTPPFEINKNRPAFIPIAFKEGARKGEKPLVGVITADFDETLSHYAGWASLSVREMRKVNKISRRASIRFNKKIKIPFTNTSPDKFEEKRQEYHRAIQEDFSNNFRVSKLLVRSVKKGETLWEICNDIYFIPFWLLASYNPDKDIHFLAVGEPIIIPVITPIKNKA